MDLIEANIYNISLTNVGFAVFLKAKDDSDQRVVPIFIGPLETHSITSVLEGTKPPRPMTHDLMTILLTTLGVQIVKIAIEEIIDNTFYAKITLRKDEELIVLDARPSDSIALALRASAPIYLAKKVIEEAGIVMKDDEIPGETIGKEKISQLPKSQLEILQDSLDNALKAEDYETAAKIRDQIRKMLENPS
ncbi:bifunctional nuclease [Leptospira broomii serovar Hurstbridge str. 5399]|uniref:Bifunctional nuclease n=4 Tax=Leptospira TaxID=171 RepID=V6HBS2_9LEPT|nr:MULTISPECIES: bifunctional nuclease domain-containing protein [Leptospira]EPG75877.1 bifunctional nuclease [Leptospira fainei serovar Hurstbridge str. BUT 6]EQA36917.1 bifunctional nuclease [Leptospira inadai serovar Lyme str. 10]EQA47130.1 bifunctional nuclease [Leptospira broomii serovar Hurstbridge str. 5399]PNV75693.1 bifunctional nuclease [Leptospira inadai serovar Lyme]